MTGHDPKASQGAKANGPGRRAARRARQAEALRANLRRRKAQKRARDGEDRPAPAKPDNG